MAKAQSKTKKRPAPKAKPSAHKKKAPARKAPVRKAKPVVIKKVAKAPPKKAAPARKPAKAVAKKAVAKAVVKPVVVKKPAKALPAIKAEPAKSTAKPIAPVKTAAVPKAPTKTAPTAAPAKAPAPPAPVAKAPEASPSKPATKPAKTKEAKPKEPIIAVMTGVDPIGGPTRTLKRAMKERFVLEFYLNATPSSLYDLLSTPSGFSEWFCDDVDVRGDQFTFRWGNETQTAQCLSRKHGELIRFQWDDEEDAGSYFELRIRIDPMTNETCLVVTDHAWPKDLDEAKALWASEIHTLQRVLGA